jgi:hypothetical protein
MLCNYGDFVVPLLLAWIAHRLQRPLALIARLASVFKSDGRILPKRELLLLAREAVGKAGTQRQLRRDAMAQHARSQLF